MWLLRSLLSSYPWWDPIAWDVSHEGKYIFSPCVKYLNTVAAFNIWPISLGYVQMAYAPELSVMFLLPLPCSCSSCATVLFWFVLVLQKSLQELIISTLNIPFTSLIFPTKAIFAWLMKYVALLLIIHVCTVTSGLGLTQQLMMTWLDLHVKVCILQETIQSFTVVNRHLLMKGVAFESDDGPYWLWSMYIESYIWFKASHLQCLLLLWYQGKEERWIWLSSLQREEKEKGHKTMGKKE